MPRHTLSMPPEAWPPALRTRFEAVFASASRHQRPRLEQGFGRWLKAAEADDLPPGMVTPALVEARTEGLRLEVAGAIRQAVQGVFPKAQVFTPWAKGSDESARDRLARRIERHAHRLPIDWRREGERKLHIDPEGLEDGILIQAWAPATVEGVLSAAWRFFDFCRDRGLPEAVTVQTVRAWLDHRQVGFREHDVSIHTVPRELEAVMRLGRALFPDRDWSWMRPAIDALKKIASTHPTRNAGRVCELVEARALAEQCAAVALEAHRSAVGYKARLRAHTLARTGLALAMLCYSPIRVGSLAALDLGRHIDPSLTTLRLAPHETKDRKADVRLIPPALRRQLRDYLEHHRPVVAPKGEAAMFVGFGGRRCAPGPLSDRIGTLTERLLGTRVTAHVMRNVVAGFIVSEAPEEAGLVTTILNHGADSTTETYRGAADQVRASRRLGEAAASMETRIDDALGARGGKRPGRRARPSLRQPARQPRASRR